MRYKIIKMNDANRSFLSNEIKKIEKDIYYPLGEDSFKIDHGEDYFAFFERLGELHYWCAFDNKKLIGVAAGILRNINGKKAWYLCDLKVIKEYRGKKIPQIIFKKAFVWNLLNKFVFRAYAVSMNNKDKNLPYHKIQRATFNLLKVHEKLNIYILTPEQKKSLMEEENLFLTNTNGCKDLILKSNKSRMELFHLTNKEKLKTRKIPSKNAVFMVSSFNCSKMDDKLKKMNAINNSDATVLSFRLNDMNPIFTDEI